MRIIGGQFGGRRLRTVSGLDVRPTSDRLRETLFNILAREVGGSSLLDLCAGSGAVGIEALSRGAGRVTFVERSPRAIVAIESNLRSIEVQWGEEAVARIYKGDAVPAIARLSKAGEVFDLIFFDPPYESMVYEQVLAQLGRGLILNRQSIVVVEHRAQTPTKQSYGKLHIYREVKQGDSAISFFSLT